MRDIGYSKRIGDNKPLFTSYNPVNSDEDTEQSSRALHYAGEKSTAAGSEEEVANETSGLECQLLQSEGTPHNNPHQHNSGVKGSVYTSTLPHGVNKHTCIYCFSVFRHTNHLRRHQREQHPGEFASYKRQPKAIPMIPQFVCDHCGRIFKRKSDLDRHIQTVHKIRHECSICQQVFCQNVH